MSRTVLLVEDDTLTANHYVRILSRNGYEAVHAPHAIAAIDMIDSSRPDIIVLDVFLAATTAFALLHELQSHYDLATIPIIILSSTADQLRQEDLAAYGVKALLDKSTIHPNDLIAAIEKVLR